MVGVEICEQATLKSSLMTLCSSVSASFEDAVGFYAETPYIL